MCRHNRHHQGIYQLRIGFDTNFQMPYLDSIKTATCMKTRKFPKWNLFLKYLSVQINTMKKAGKYARLVAFRAKNSPSLCNVYIFFIYQ